MNFLKGSSEPPIPESEKKYYKPDDYYTDYVPLPVCDMSGNPKKAEVITFEKRKKISNKSRNGLYVAEILLLYYVSTGTYPHPKKGYPAFWWFEYGIKNVGARLQSLEERGFIRYAARHESAAGLTSAELKEILKSHNLPVSGKKCDLAQRVKEKVRDNDLKKYIPEPKYALTDLGKSELSENEYVPIVHKHPFKTHEPSMCEYVFSVWEVNRRLSTNPDWRSIIDDLEREMMAYFRGENGK